MKIISVSVYSIWVRGWKQCALLGWEAPMAGWFEGHRAWKEGPWVWEECGAAGLQLWSWLGLSVRSFSALALPKGWDLCCRRGCGSVRTGAECPQAGAHLPMPFGWRRGWEGSGELHCCRVKGPRVFPPPVITQQFLLHMRFYTQEK